MLLFMFSFVVVLFFFVSLLLFIKCGFERTICGREENGFSHKQLKPVMSDRFCRIHYVNNNIPSPTKKLRKFPFCLFSNDVEFQKRNMDS